MRTAGRARERTASAAILLFVDLGCPLCRREAAWLRRLDRGRGRVRLVDIAGADFDPALHAGGRDLDTLMARIHARLPDGAWVEGVEAFRRVYSALGLGWLVAPTRLPGVRRLLDLAYRRFARRRLERRCAEGWCQKRTPAVRSTPENSFSSAK